MNYIFRPFNVAYFLQAKKQVNHCLELIYEHNRKTKHTD